VAWVFALPPRLNRADIACRSVSKPAPLQAIFNERTIGGDLPEVDRQNNVSDILTTSIRAD
jgi:hypothetical protein